MQLSPDLARVKVESPNLNRGKAYLNRCSPVVARGAKNGKRPLRPKGEGQGTMVSAYCSDHDGLGLTITEDQLQAVNAMRAAAQPSRPPLTEEPGIRYFEYGTNRQGYWDSSAMLDQVVDFLDCFQIIHPNKQLLLELDNSGCHTKMPEDGYISTHLNWGIGGAQQVPAPLKITHAAQVGPHAGRRVSVGDTFYFTFQEGDPPPLLNPEMPADKYIGVAKGACVRGGGGWCVLC